MCRVKNYTRHVICHFKDKYFKQSVALVVATVT